MDGFDRKQWTVQAALVWLRTGNKDLVRAKDLVSAANSEQVPLVRAALWEAGIPMRPGPPPPPPPFVQGGDDVPADDWDTAMRKAEQKSAERELDDQKSRRLEIARVRDGYDPIVQIQQALLDGKYKISARSTKTGTWRDFQHQDLGALRLDLEGGARWRDEYFDVVYLPRAAILSIRSDRPEGATCPDDKTIRSFLFDKFGRNPGLNAAWDAVRIQYPHNCPKRDAVSGIVKEMNSHRGPGRPRKSSQHR